MALHLSLSEPILCIPVYIESVAGPHSKTGPSKGAQSFVREIGGWGNHNEAYCLLSPLTGNKRLPVSGEP